jgi:hypothetical protein
MSAQRPGYRKHPDDGNQRGKYSKAVDRKWTG